MAQRSFANDWLAVGLALSLGLVALSLGNVTSRVDNLFYDWSLRASPRATPDDIVLVAIDEASLSALGPWPWPRALHAALLRRLAAAQPKAVVYDVLFLTPSAIAGEDAALGSALAKLPRVYAPMLFKAPGDDSRAYDPIWPIDSVRRAAGVGHADIHPDDDGVVRRLNLALDGEQRWRHVAAMAAAGTRGGDHALAALPLAPARAAGSPLRRAAPVLVSFGGPPGHIRTASFVSVLRGETPAGLLRGRYVLVGATAPGLGDQFSTPVGGESGIMPGVEIQANLLDTLISGRTVREAGYAARLATGLLALWIVMFGFLRLGPNAAALLGLSTIAALLVGSGVLLFGGQVWLPPTAAMIVLAVAQPIWSWRRLSSVSGYMVEELSRLAADPDLPAGPPRSRPLGQDRIANQVDLLRDTVARVRGLRRLVGAALHSLPDPTVLVGLTGDIVLANAEAERLFKPTGTLRARDIEDFFAKSGAPDFSPTAFEAGDAPWNGERTGRDGGVRQIRHVPWTDDAGAPLGWVVRFADITALRRAEVAREEALQLLTHDMRSPQASILALVAGADKTLSPALGERLAHYARRTIDLADGFLRLARADAGDYAKSLVDMADVVVEAADDLWPVASARGVVIDVAPEGEFLVLGNRTLLLRAVLNLIDNAVKFSPTGGHIDVAVRLSAADATVTSAQVVCTVTDHGAGMTPQVLAKLFRRFSHHDRGHGGPVDGVGLGLAFVRSVVIGHGGAITCRSEPGEGATFEITLPALDSKG